MLCGHARRSKKYLSRTRPRLCLLRIRHRFCGPGRMRMRTHRRPAPRRGVASARAGGRRPTGVSPAQLRTNGSASAGTLQSLLVSSSLLAPARRRFSVQARSLPRLRCPWPFQVAGVAGLASRATACGMRYRTLRRDGRAFTARRSASRQADASERRTLPACRTDRSRPVHGKVPQGYERHDWRG